MYCSSCVLQQHSSQSVSVRVIGKFVSSGLHEVWEDGQAFKEMQTRLRALSEAKASIEAARKASTHMNAC